MIKEAPVDAPNSLSGFKWRMVTQGAWMQMKKPARLGGDAGAGAGADREIGARLANQTV